MTFSAEQIAALQAPLGSSHVKSRSQAGRSLSYIEGWHAIAEANRIFGFSEWDRETVEIRQLCEPYKDGRDNWRVSYMAKVTIRVIGTSIGVRRDGCGYGSGIDKDLGQAHESAIKEAETDAMKRALMTFGNPFGLALYDKDQANVVDDTRRPAPAPTKPSSVELSITAKTLIKAIGMAATQPDLAQWFADNKGTIEGLHEDEKDEVRLVYAEKHASMKRAA